MRQSLHSGVSLLCVGSLVALLSGAACSSSGDTSTVDAAPPASDGGTPSDLALPRSELWNSDVTIVYPLPSISEINPMVWASTLGNYGRFLPLSLFTQIPRPLDPRSLSSTRTTDSASWSALRLIAARLDPCFGSLGEVPDSLCKNQVRLVFQGIHPVGDASAADDGAIHALYELPRADLLALTREIIQLTESQGGYTPGPLGVHPILKRQGVWGPFGQGLKALWRRYLGEERLVRMTFMVRLAALESEWEFGGFDRVGSEFHALNIPTSATSPQTLRASFAAIGDLNGATATPTSSADNLLVLINSNQARAASATTRQAAFAAALRIQNPNRHTPDTIDCVSCHVALAAQSLGETQFALSSLGHPDRFVSSRDLRFQSPAEPSLENLHASSYIGTELGINPRTANESAAVASYLEALLRK